MTKQDKPRPLLSGILYGESAFWITIIGLMIVIVGIAIYFIGGNQFFSSRELMSRLLAGDDVNTIWKGVTGQDIKHGHWYLSNLSTGDGICMLGMAICGLSGIIGTLAIITGMIINREKPRFFIGFALIVVTILILSATGAISVR